MSDAPETLRPLPVRIAPRAERDIEEARSRFVALSGEPIGDAWMDALYEQLTRIGGTPEGYKVAEAESRRLGVAVREASFARAPGTAAYRIYYTVIGDEAHAFGGRVDPPCVFVLHVRHGARRPMTRAEARRRRKAIDEEG